MTHEERVIRQYLEIEKAVEEYAESLKSIAFENLSREETPYLLRGAFKEGLDSANNHWQEKTRWRSLETEPPKFEGQKYQILVRHSTSMHDVACIIGLHSVEILIAAGYREWKEIE